MCLSMQILVFFTVFVALVQCSPVAQKSDADRLDGGLSSPNTEAENIGAEGKQITNAGLKENGFTSSGSATADESRSLEDNREKGLAAKPLIDKEMKEDTSESDSEEEEIMQRTDRGFREDEDDEDDGADDDGRKKREVSSTVKTETTKASDIKSTEISESDVAGVKHSRRDIPVYPVVRFRGRSDEEDSDKEEKTKEGKTN